MSSNEFTKLLIQDIIKFGEDISKYVGQQITNDLYEEARSAIKDFYSDYTPKYYVRNYNFWKSYKKYHQNYGGVRTAGVELRMFQLPDDYRGHNSDPINVFWRVYNGYHGIASFISNRIGAPTASTINRTTYVPITSPSPLQRLEKKRDEIIKNQSKYKDKAEQMALAKEKYNIIN